LHSERILKVSSCCVFSFLPLLTVGRGLQFAQRTRSQGKQLLLIFFSTSTDCERRSYYLHSQRILKITTALISVSFFFVLCFFVGQFYLKALDECICKERVRGDT
jgi:uncharacterized membrane protein